MHGVTQVYGFAGAVVRHQGKACAQIDASVDIESNTRYLLHSTGHHIPGIEAGRCVLRRRTSRPDKQSDRLSWRRGIGGVKAAGGDGECLDGLGLSDPGGITGAEPRQQSVG
jgi:hypothetical protein